MEMSGLPNMQDRTRSDHAGGVITEFPTPSSGSTPTGIATGADGSLWSVNMDQRGGQISKADA